MLSRELSPLATPGRSIGVGAHLNGFIPHFINKALICAFVSFDVLNDHGDKRGKGFQNVLCGH